MACADGEIEVEEDRQPRAIAGALTINAGMLELEIALAVGLSERPAVGVAGREVDKVW